MSRWKLAVKNNAWILIVLVVFGAVYACSLVFTYVDADDALALEYHVLGRNEAVQPPPERFQMAMDAILTLLPPSEPIVRMTAMSITSIAAIGLVLLLLRLCFDCMNVYTPRERVLLTMALLLASPEFIYLGLLYTPMLVGMCLVVGAHLLIRSVAKHASENSPLTLKTGLVIAASGIMMGLGGLFRWDILAYGLVVVLDIGLDPFASSRNGAQSLGNRARIVAVWGVLALLTWSVMELLRGDLPQAIAETRAGAIEGVAESSLKDIRLLPAHAMLFSPAFLVPAVGGWLSFVRKGGALRWFVGGMSLFTLLWPFWFTPKEVLVLVPFFVLLFANGFISLWQVRLGSRINIFFKTAMMLLLLVPWFFGIQLLFDDSAWGPGFEVRAFTHAKGEGIQNVHIAFRDGAGFPTDEGPRPFFGHAAVLFLGKWRELHELQEEEHLMAVRRAIQDTIPYLVLMDCDAFQMNRFARFGYTTSDPEGGRRNKIPVVRHLRNRAGEERILVHFVLEQHIKDTSFVLMTLQDAGSEKVIVWGEPARMRKIFLFAPAALQELGPRTALLDLRRLLSAARLHTEEAIKLK